MSKFNLSEAAKAILEGSKETFTSNIASKRGGQDKSAKLHGDAAYGTKEVGSINANVTMGTKDDGPNPTKGVPTATPPGATPPVGSEPMKHLSPQPQQSQGRSDLHDIKKTDAVAHDPAHAERKPSKLAPQMMHKNAGANFQSYAEDIDMTDDVQALL